MIDIPFKEQIKSMTSGWRRAKKPRLFDPDQMEIIVNRETFEAWIFHLESLPVEVAHIDYNHADNSMTFTSEQGHTYELSVKIGPLIRPVIEKVEFITVAQVHEGMPISWFTAPVRHHDVGKKPEKEDGDAGDSAKDGEEASADASAQPLETKQEKG